MINFKYNKQKGFTLLEMVFYISIFAVFSLVLINTMILMTKSFRESMTQSDIVQSSHILERIMRDVRDSSTITTISANNLKLTLQSGDTVEFVLSNEDIVLYENDILIGNLNSTNVKVEEMTFTQINTTSSTAVKAYISLRSTRDLQNKVFDFYSTGVLRGSY